MERMTLLKTGILEKILTQLKAIGQLDRLMAHPSFSLHSLEKLLETLLPVQEFYQEMGGLTGYHEKILSLLEKKKDPKTSSSQDTSRDSKIGLWASAKAVDKSIVAEGRCIDAILPPSATIDFRRFGAAQRPIFESREVYHSPSFIDISKMDAATEQYIAWGLSALPEMAEMIPLGGAADRLHLVDEATGKELPAAKLRFAGKILLQRLIEDVQAREKLYFQLYGKHILTPIGMMTSFEKDNHFHVMKILEENRWFDRPKELFHIVPQPLVPVVNEKGDWLFSEDLKWVMKPGGHGAIWKLAIDTGMFSWFESLGRKKALIRQINNPIAGLDYGLLAFLGIGWKKNKKFGFASCPRLLRAAEGVNVLIENQAEGKIVLTNIEYCDFAKFGIEDLPLKEGEPYSRFSSNTNLLFVDLPSIREAVQKCPFPGLLLNLKKVGGSHIGRLESTMQNIADVFVEEKKNSLVPENTFITYNQRHKTISTTKRAFVEGGTLQETPESCFFDFLFAARELLESFCSFALPYRRSLEESLAKGPEFVFLYHPSLGPLYSMIAQKLEGGVLLLGAELNLEISDLLVRGLTVDGSLRLSGQGRCTLKNVRVLNRGVDWDRSRPFWKGDFCRHESVEIVLKGDSEFIAEGVTFVGSHRLIVEEGMSMRVSEVGGELFFSSEKLKKSDMS